VSIASYDDCHYEQIVKAVSNGKHVFVEKPLCTYEEEAAHIHALLREHPRVKISSNLILRRSPRFLQLKEMISAGRLGQIFYLEGDYNYGRLHKITEGWRGQRGFYSVIYGGAVHMVDLLQWLVNDTVVEVSACGNHIASAGSPFRFNDMVVGTLTFNNGIVAKVSTNYGCVYPHFHRLSVYGTQATFENGIPNALLYESRDKETPPATINSEYPGTHKGDLLSNFVRSIVTGEAAIVSKQDVFSTMSVCFALEKAVREKSVVQVNYF
jgi:predicted dehydrogenase